MSKCKEEGRPCTLHELKKTYTMELVCDCESLKGRINLGEYSCAAFSYEVWALIIDNLA